jgi:hypothetical protein
VAFAPLGDNLCQIGPGQNVASAAGVDKTGQQGESTVTLLGAGPLAEESGDDPVPQGPVGSAKGSPPSLAFKTVHATLAAHGSSIDGALFMST